LRRRVYDVRSVRGAGALAIDSSWNLLGTTAALDNPRCHKTSPSGDSLYFGYGRFDSTVVGGGPVCVKAWKEGADNGGATWQGVTKDKVTVVVMLPNETQLESDPVKPKHLADKSASTYEDAVHDYVLPLMKYFETWGRDVEFKFITSSGSDEAAQRADVVKVKAMKPFAVFHIIVAGADVFETELAKAHIPVMGYSTTATKANLQAPYRWGLSDAQSSAINSAEVIGKQLVGKKAEYGGADVKNQTRKFGVVYIKSLVDYPKFEDFFKKYKGTIASANAYEANGSTFGDAAVSDEVAPTFVTRMKAAGVTTVILLSDHSMNSALMKEATKQEWFPEWYLTGAVFQDIAIFARAYPTEQAAHMFGVSNLSPYVQPDPTPAPPAKALSVQILPLEWYWGEGVGTQVTSVVPRDLVWLMRGIHTAGPDLTPKTFQQGLFSIPATGGAASGYTTGALVGYGRTPGLPYDEYMDLGLDFAPVWWDAETTGLSNGTGVSGKGVNRYVDGGKRYRAGTWPKEQFAWFEDAGTVVDFPTRQTPTPVYAGDCSECPAGGGPGQAGAANAEGFVAKANGQGEAAS